MEETVLPRLMQINQNSNHWLIWVFWATHDPLVISGMTRQQVRVMRRDSMDAPIRAEMPETDPQAMVNAVCHRDYLEEGAQVMVEIF